MIDPTPPAADTSLPWDTPVADPVAAIDAARRRWGDSFTVIGPDTRYLFLFSPAAVAAFYALDEADASKGVADWRMLRRKLPDELFVGRRTLPHELFGRTDVTDYLHVLDAVIDHWLDQLGTAGHFEIFEVTRTIGHRLSLGSWAGQELLDDPGLERAIVALDELDASAAFVRPEEIAAVATVDHELERQAIATVSDALYSTIAGRWSAGARDDLLQRIVDRWLDEPIAIGAAGVAGDIILLHQASMSNLFAAMGWMMVDLLLHAEHQPRVVNDRDHAERCALESTRLAQRSIMLREVLRPITVPDSDGDRRVTPGVTLATLLPLTNRSAAPGLDRYRPERWERRRLVDPPAREVAELVTVFGHGRHTCPAQPFALAAMTTVARRLLLTLDLEPRFDAAQPRPGQIGGVARAERPCEVSYRRR